MEFDLRIITNGNRANISLEYNGTSSIDKEKLKKSINEIVDIILLNKNNDFVDTNILIKDDNIENEKQPDYIKDTPPLEKLKTNETINGGIFMEQQDKSSIVVKNDRSYMSYIVVSQIRQDKSIA